MTLIELASAEAVQSASHRPSAIICFSAHWCGPCKASKPALEALATKMVASCYFGIAYEDTLGDALQSQFNVRAFPTYVMYKNGKEVDRVQGADLAKVEAMAKTADPMPTGPGATLGSTIGKALSPAEAREARLAKLGGSSAAAPSKESDSSTKNDPEPMEEDTKPPAKSDDAKESDGDTKMKDAEATSPADPAANLDPEILKTLTEAMGFSLLRAQKGLLFGNGKTTESAVEWLMEHQEDTDIDDPIPEGAGGVAQSYKCNECGKILSNMANLELHASKTGHSDFEESTDAVTPLTAEEKAAKIGEIKALLKAKRTEREEAEKVDNVEKELQRRSMGQQIAKTREQADSDQRKRETRLRRKEKEDFKKERERLKAQLAQDKAERAAQNGRLNSRLGADGYKPDAIQYDKDGDGADANPEERKQKRAKADASKIDEYIAKVSGYKAGGDGGKCLKILKIYIGNVVDNPTENKFKSIKTDNKAYKIKVKPLLGAKSLLMACGFKPDEKGDFLVLAGDDADIDVLKSTKAKLEAAMAAY